jgi:hypothetical protein
MRYCEGLCRYRRPPPAPRSPNPSARAGSAGCWRTAGCSPCPAPALVRRPSPMLAVAPTRPALARLVVADCPPLALLGSSELGLHAAARGSYPAPCWPAGRSLVVLCEGMAGCCDVIHYPLPAIEPHLLASGVHPTALLPSKQRSKYLLCRSEKRHNPRRASPRPARTQASPFRC